MDSLEIVHIFGRQKPKQPNPAAHMNTLNSYMLLLQDNNSFRLYLSSVSIQPSFVKHLKILFYSVFNRFAVKVKKITFDIQIYTHLHRNKLVLVCSLCFK